MWICGMMYRKVTCVSYDTDCAVNYAEHYNCIGILVLITMQLAT